MSSPRVPDVLGKLTAYRVFGVSSSGRLESTGVGYEWQAGENRADCTDRAHSAPVRSCNCGFWSFRTKEIAREQFEDTHGGRDNIVLAKVRVWGKVVEGERGFRSQYAEVVRLLWCNCPASDLTRAADRYGVRVAKGCVGRPATKPEPPRPFLPVPALLPAEPAFRVTQARPCWPKVFARLLLVASIGVLGLLLLRVAVTEAERMATAPHPAGTQAVPTTPAAVSPPTQAPTITAAPAPVPPRTCDIWEFDLPTPGSATGRSSWQNMTHASPDEIRREHPDALNFRCAWPLR